MPRRARSNLLLLEQNNIFHAHFCQMISNGVSDDPTTNNHYSCLAKEKRVKKILYLNRDSKQQILPVSVLVHDCLDCASSDQPYDLLKTISTYQRIQNILRIPFVCGCIKDAKN